MGPPEPEFQIEHEKALNACEDLPGVQRTGVWGATFVPVAPGAGRSHAGHSVEMGPAVSSQVRGDQRRAGASGARRHYLA